MHVEQDDVAGKATFHGQVDGAAVTIEVHGEGPPILILGGATPRAWTAPLVGALCGDHAVIDFDYEPLEPSDEPPVGRTCVELMSDAAEVMDIIGLPRAHVVGVSRGAAVAYALATRHAARVSGLSLVTPVAPFPGYLDQPSSSDRDIDDEDELLAYVGDLLFSREYQSAAPDVVRAAVFGAPSSVVRVPRRDEQTLPPTEVPSQPVQVLVARDDTVVARDDAEAIRAAIPQVDWRELPGKHGAQHEHARDWAEAIRRFVSRDRGVMQEAT